MHNTKWSLFAVPFQEQSHLKEVVHRLLATTIETWQRDSWVLRPWIELGYCIGLPQQFRMPACTRLFLLSISAQNGWRTRIGTEDGDMMHHAKNVENHFEWWKYLEVVHESAYCPTRTRNLEQECPGLFFAFNLCFARYPHFSLLKPAVCLWNSSRTQSWDVQTQTGCPPITQIQVGKTYW